MPRPWAVESSRSQLNSSKRETPRDKPVVSFGLFVQSYEGEWATSGCCGWDSAAAQAKSLGYSRKVFIVGIAATGGLRPLVAGRRQDSQVKAGVCSS